MKKLFTILLIFSSVYAQAGKLASPEFIAIEHASLIIRANGLTVFVDPVGDVARYAAYGKPDVILITHEHGDHLDIPLLNALKTDKTEVIVTEVVFKKTGFGKIMHNNEQLSMGKLLIESIPAYNTTTERLNFHPKGVGNGYVLTLNGKRIYISGDTEDIPDMCQLKKIDYAFICMNLPYTMSVEQAASAILKFKPKNIYPYHYRNQDKTFADIHGKLKDLLSVNKNINIRYLNWYDQDK